MSPPAPSGEQGGETLPVRPIFLCADSQLLFWQEKGGRPFLDRVRAELGAAVPKAAYVGASNGDLPEFYDLFVSAMQGIDVTDCRMIPSAPSDEDLAFFDDADLILLAGGDVRRGWRTFKKNGLRQKVIERYYGGAVLLGISAGAVQLGLHGWHKDEAAAKLRVFESFKLIPAVVDVHDERDEWSRLARCLEQVGGEARGLGIPSGGGAVLYQDLTLEPIRRSLVEIARDEDGEPRQSLIFPGEV